jgi:hypothetical protein
MEAGVSIEEAQKRREEMEERIGDAIYGSLIVALLERHQHLKLTTDDAIALANAAHWPLTGAVMSALQYLNIVPEKVELPLGGN